LKRTERRATYAASALAVLTAEVRTIEQEMVLEVQKAVARIRESQTSIAALEKKLTQAEAVAQKKASIECERLEKELAANRAVADQEASRVAVEVAEAAEREAALQERLRQVMAVKERVKSQLATCASLLNRTRAAGMHGGYCFSAAKPQLNGRATSELSPSSPLMEITSELRPSSPLMEITSELRPSFTSSPRMGIASEIPAPSSPISMVPAPTIGYEDNSGLSAFASAAITTAATPRADASAGADDRDSPLHADSPSLTTCSSPTSRTATSPTNRSTTSPINNTSSPPPVGHPSTPPHPSTSCHSTHRCSPPSSHQPEQNPSHAPHSSQVASLPVAAARHHPSPPSALSPSQPSTQPTSTHSDVLVLTERRRTSPAHPTDPHPHPHPVAMDLFPSELSADERRLLQRPAKLPPSPTHPDPRANPSPHATPLPPLQTQKQPTEGEAPSSPKASPTNANAQHARRAVSRKLQQPGHKELRANGSGKGVGATTHGTPPPPASCVGGESHRHTRQHSHRPVRSAAQPGKSASGAGGGGGGPAGGARSRGRSISM